MKKDILGNIFRQTPIEIILNTHIKYMHNNFDAMNNIDSKNKKKLSGFIPSDQVTKELDDLLKLYSAETVQPDLKKTKTILSKFNVNKELLKMRQEY